MVLNIKTTKRVLLRRGQRMALFDYKHGSELCSIFIISISGTWNGMVHNAVWCVLASHAGASYSGINLLGGANYSQGTIYLVVNGNADGRIDYLINSGESGSAEEMTVTVIPLNAQVTHWYYDSPAQDESGYTTLTRTSARTI